MSRKIGKNVSDFLYAHRITFGTLAKPIIAATMKDLDVFSDRTRRFQGAQTAGEFLVRQLQTLLRQYADKSVLLIGHSLGSVIAYMTLQTYPDLTVDLFLSIGSPLMQLGFRQAWVEGQKEFHFADCPWPVVPPNIRAWKNFIDRKDPVLVKSPPALREYYLTRDGKQVIEDHLVQNSYTCSDSKGRTVVSKPHNSYGYLRCPEVSHAIREFLLGA